MQKFRFLLAAFSTCFLPIAVSAEPTSAVAVLEAKSNSKVSGKLDFAEKDGSVTISGTISGLTPGKHGFHIHEIGDCSASDGSSAGGHFNPTKHDHGAPDSALRHLGDLGNIDASESGVTEINIHDSEISLSGAQTIVGRSIVIHQNADDLKTQPSGASGDRIACGVIAYN